MSFKWDRVHVWSCEIPDHPGSVAEKLAHLAQGDANLEYIFTKRLPNKPGFGVLYVAPVTGAAQVRAAKAAEMHEVDSPVVRRIEGDNEAGLAHRVTQKWALAGISLQGLTMAVIGARFIGYAAFDTVNDANRAAQILADLGLAAAIETKMNGN
ncbi:MAG: amino acid-binding ACT [Planctomycetes bacterium]|nr:amino acid-binding ACT [Planctomycetota bacterium]